MAKPINFICVAPGAIQVHLAGDFNSWDPVGLPMRKQPDGAWTLQVPLRHGHHQYVFLVDGQPTLDPHAHGVACSLEGKKVSLLAVS